MRILVLSFSHIGDAVLSTCIIPPLKDEFPGCHLSYLLNPESAPVLKGDPRIDEVLIYDKRHLHKGLRGKVRLIKDLKDRRFDLVVDLRDAPWSSLIGRERWRIRREIRRSRRHAVQRYLDVLRTHGIDVRGAKPEIELRSEEIESADRFLAERGADEGERFIGIHPGGGWPYKLWGTDRFSELAERLSERLGLNLLLFAGPEEENLAESVERRVKGKAIKCVGLPLRTAAALMRRCSIYVGNDTGTTHLAAAVGVPTVALFGPTDHLRSSPYGERVITIVGRFRMDCAPCHPGRHPGGCGISPCPVIRSIGVDDVLKACLEAIARWDEVRKYEG